MTSKIICAVLLLASCATLNPPVAGARPRTVRAAFVRHTASLTTAQPTEASQPVLCLEQVLETALNAAGGPENAGLTISFAVVATPLGVLGFSFEQGGPFTDALVVSVTLDAFGNGQSKPFFFKALTPGVTVVTACSFAGCAFNPFTVTVASVDVVLFDEFNSALDGNPNTGGGLRIFTDKQSPQDTVDRQTVRVRAIASVPMPGLPVFFRSFDLDDPSSDDKPVDPNGLEGDDNLGIQKAGVLSALSEPTDPLGIAESVLIVSMKPGDNYMVAASCDPAYLQTVTVDGITLRDGAGMPLPTDRAASTDMLTVWRRLHVEVDAMGTVVGNTTTGTIAQAILDQKHVGTTDFDVEATTHQSLESHRFRRGLITVDGVASFAVTDNGKSSVEVAGVVENAAVAGKGFTLVDDDDFNEDDGFLALDGDEGENVTDPDLGFIDDSRDDSSCDNSAANVFGPAYVCPVFDVGPIADVVPFVLNAPKTFSDQVATYAGHFDSKATERDPNFWTVYLLGAYQGEPNRDLDGEVDGLLGATVVGSVANHGTMIFLETIADLKRTEGDVGLGCSVAAIVAHELGHQLGGVHPDRGLMTNPCQDATTAFSTKTLATIRQLTFP